MVKVSPATAPAGKPIFTVNVAAPPSSVLSIMPSLLASFTMVTVGADGAVESTLNASPLAVIVLPAASVALIIGV